MKIDSYILNMFVNDKHYWKNQEIAKIKYRFAFGATSKGNSVTILSVENN